MDTPRDREINPFSKLFPKVATLLTKPIIYIPLIATVLIGGGLTVYLIFFSQQNFAPKGSWGKRPGGPEDFRRGPAGGEQNLGKNNQGFPLPPLDANAPLPTLPANTPKGEWVTKKLGSVEIKYFSTAIIWGMSESGTDVFITLKNKGNSRVVVNFTPVTELIKQVPKWNLHFFTLQNPPLTLEANEEKKLWYFASLDQAGNNLFTVNFKLWLDSNSTNSLEIPIKFGTAEGNFERTGTSAIYGYIKDEKGKVLAGVDINAQTNCGRLGFRGSSDSQGRFAIPVLAKEDVNAIYQGKDLACASKDYYLWAEKDGYEFYFKNHLNPDRKNYVQSDIVLKKNTDSTSYSLKWEKEVAEPYGFFWVKPSADWSVFAAAQAKHEPQLGKPTNFYLLDSSGNVLWKQPTGNECWGIDIAPDGSKVITGCHDGKIYMVSRAGKLLWTYDATAMVRSACISNDGKTALSGTVGKLFLFNAESGEKKEVAWGGSWLRNCLFSPDGSGFIAGSPEIGAFDMSGNQKWLQEIGEFPMFLGTDKDKNVFAAGKSRTLFSFGNSGDLRWKDRIPDHVITYGAATPDGKRIAVGTIGGMVYLFDSSGNVLWKRPIGTMQVEGSVGHNAVAMSADGKRIVVGSAPGNCLLVYNEKGTLLWKKCSESKNIGPEMRKGITNVQISPDKTKIIASYGDNYIREFIKK